jgi:Domain of unknown function (DUF5916)
MTKFLLLLICLLSGFVINAQTPKTLEAKRTTQKVVIDGKLSDAAWQDAAKADDFIEFRPTIGKKEEPGNHTEAFLMYDDDGIYFGGTCYEKDVKNISKELAGRDGFGGNDYIGLIIDTYNDKLNGFEYFITPLGEQWDSKMTSNQNSNNGGEDFSWNAVWKSAVELHDKGWTFEIFLPYSAIRFGKAKIQDWGLNITRRRRKTEQQNTWNPIDPNKNGFLTQEGIWKGISDIKPPIRLQLYPYFSYYQNHYPLNQSNQSNWTNQISGGMDLKLGLSQAFTLDATLIPDFGQVQSDNQVLNLTPFEVKFNENRQFFTEGTELFSKGNLFYSRRIGGRPLRQYDVYNNLSAVETVLKNPTESKLINASKISGRTQSGLGIGILNAITKPQHAVIENSLTKETREYETDPTTNYNIIVLDQNLKNNSSVTFINTNVTRKGQDNNANVSAGLFSLNNKKNMYNLTGRASISHLNYKKVNDKENVLGYSHALTFSKTSGKMIFAVAQELTDTKYTSNDLGYFTNNNFINHWGYVNYRFTEPKGWYNRITLNLYAGTSHLFAPIGDIKTKYQQSNIRFNFNAQSKKLIWFGIFANHNLPQNDFYEPRSEGKVFKRGARTAFGGWVETNYAKKYYISGEIAQVMYYNFYNLIGTDLYLTQNYRFNSKFSVTHRIGLEPRPRGMGYTTTLDDGTTIFALRNVKTVDNTLSFKYNFTNKMGLTFRARHYASLVKNKAFYTLKSDGLLSPNDNITTNLDRNVNYFNIDMVYTWQFAPGSFLNLVWKNATAHDSDNARVNYFENLGNTLESNQNNNFSVKVIYFLDYLQLKRGLK